MGILVQVQVTFGYRKSGVELGIWLKQGDKKSLLARILKILEETRKRLSRQKSTKKCVNSSKESVNSTKKIRKLARKVQKCEENMEKNVRKPKFYK